MSQLPQPDPRLISEEDFCDKKQWGAYVKRNGDLFEHRDVVSKPLHNVWTIVEADDEDGSGRTHWIALPGFHVVNKLGYCLTTQPWGDESLEAYWFFDDDLGAELESGEPLAD